MASVVFLQSCCLGNDTVVINYDVPVNGVSIEITVISIISLVIAGASSFGILCVLCSCGATEEVTRRSRRYLVQSPSVNHVTKCLTVAGILANCGLVVRSGVWLAGGYPRDTDTDFSDYRHILCVITSTWIVYFFLCVNFWHVVYALEVFLASKGKKSICAAKHFIGWLLPAAICSLVAFFGYHEVLKRCKAREKATRMGMFALYLTPVVISMILVAVLFNRTLKEVKRSLIAHFGMFSVLERETLSNIRVKFIIVTSAFFICWLPNILNGILISSIEEKSNITLVLLVLETVLNPFQVLIDTMVMFSWPPAGCFGIFRSSHDHNPGNVNIRRVRFEALDSDDETDPLISFSRNRKR